MPNYLTPAKKNLDRARAQLEQALSLLKTPPGGRRSTDVIQSLNVTNGMAQVFADKPVIIIQTMDVRILQVNDQINAALRALDKIDSLSMRALTAKGAENG